MEYTPIDKQTLKTLVGKEIFVIPLGNNVARGSKPLEEQIKSVIVIKVTSQTISTDNYSVGTFKHNSEYDRHNCGYMAFLSEADALEYLDLDRFSRKLTRSDLNLSAEKLRAIKKIVES